MTELLRKARSNWVSVLFWMAYYTDDPDCQKYDAAELAQWAEMFEYPGELSGSPDIDLTALNFSNIHPALMSKSRTIHDN